ncbi:hypothetical protein FWH09_01240 [Candidatus Saccharibacteria bacterium]|nr:hypothetical protein [Candidatus Saccharibacteria bacterium]
MKRKKVLGILIVVILLAGLLVACGNGHSEAVDLLEEAGEETQFPDGRYRIKVSINTIDVDNEEISVFIWDEEFRDLPSEYGEVYQNHFFRLDSGAEFVFGSQRIRDVRMVGYLDAYLTLVIDDGNVVVAGGQIVGDDLSGMMAQVEQGLGDFYQVDLKLFGEIVRAWCPGRSELIVGEIYRFPIAAEGRNGIVILSEPLLMDIDPRLVVETTEQLAMRVLWGQFDDFPKRLYLLRHRYWEVQARVNEILAPKKVGGGNIIDVTIAGVDEEARRLTLMSSEGELVMSVKSWDIAMFSWAFFLPNLPNDFLGLPSSSVHSGISMSDLVENQIGVVVYYDEYDNGSLRVTEIRVDPRYVYETQIPDWDWEYFDGGWTDDGLTIDGYDISVDGVEFAREFDPRGSTIGVLVYGDGERREVHSIDNWHLVDGEWQERESD